MNQNEAPKIVQARGLRAGRLAVAYLVVALILAACGTSVRPVSGIKPTSAGSVLIQVKPADAEVILVPEGASLDGRGVQPQLVDGEYGLLEYDLDPGSYTVQASRSGYETAQSTFSLSEEDLDGEGTIRPVTLVLEESVQSGGNDDGQTGGDAVTDTRGLEMLVDPNFSTSDLSSEMREQYELFWRALNNPDGSLDPRRKAASDDSYEYARDLHNSLQTMLLMLRFTGDQDILDEVYEITQIMRGELKDAWDDGTTDGYLGWMYRYGDGSQFYGKDNHQMNDLKTSAIIATVAYAFDLNRDVDPRYAEAADFWEHYLVDHYEAKWRERTGKSEGYPIYRRPHSHTYMSGIKYHYYMYQLTGDPEYLAYAELASDRVWEGFIEVDTEAGRSGYVWNRSILAELRDGDLGENYLLPTTYARYFYADVVEFHLAGFHTWANADMSLFAHVVADFVIDREGTSGSDWFARDVGGGKSRGGIPSSSSWDRQTTNVWYRSPYVLLAPWDETGKIADTSVDVLREVGKLSNPGSPHIAAGLFMDIALN